MTDLHKPHSQQKCPKRETSKQISKRIEKTKQNKTEFIVPSYFEGGACLLPFLILRSDDLPSVFISTQQQKHQQLASTLSKISLKTLSDLEMSLARVSAMTQSDLGDRWHHSKQAVQSPN